MKYDLDRINKARKRRGLDPLPVRGRGRPAIGEAPTKAELVELYQRQGLSLRAAAQVLGTSKEAVLRGLAEYGIETRPASKPSRLAVYGPAELRRRIDRDGLRATARALSVNPATLLEHMRRYGPKR